MPNDPLQFPVGNVPIIGKPAELLAAYPTAVIRCNCEAKTTMVIVSVGVVVKCTACQRKFTVASWSGVQLAVVAEKESAHGGS